MGINIFLQVDVEKGMVLVGSQEYDNSRWTLMKWNAKNMMNTKCNAQSIWRDGSRFEEGMSVRVDKIMKALGQNLRVGVQDLGSVGTIHYICTYSSSN